MERANIVVKIVDKQAISHDSYRQTEVEGMIRDVRV